MPTNPNPNRRKNIKPGLSVPADLNHPELEKFLQGVKEALQGADGTRGQPLERFVTLQDLKDAGLINTGVKNGRGIITELLVPEAETESTSSGGSGEIDDTGAQDGDVLEFNDSTGRWTPYALFDVSLDPSVVRRDRLPEEIAFDNEDETITGVWEFDEGVTINSEDGLNIVNPNRTGGGGVQITSESGSDPQGDGVGNTLAFWEAGVVYGYRFHHDGTPNASGDMIFYGHDNSAAGVEYFRFARDRAQIQATAGSDSIPFYSFAGDTDLGIYRSSANVLGFAAGGAAATLSSTVFSANVLVRATGDSAATPSFAWTNDTNSGMFRVANDNIGWSTSGTQRMDLSTTAFTITLPIREADGSAATPSYSFSSDTNTGLYWISADSFGISLAGSLRVTYATTGITYTVPLLVGNGAVGAPSYSFSSDTNTGMYRNSTDVLSLVTAGADRLLINENGAFGLGGTSYGSAGQVLTSNGSGAVPTWEDAGEGGGGGGGGALVYVNTSVPAGNTVASTSSETAFASTYDIPANTLQEGTVVRVRGHGVFSTDAGAAPNLTVRVEVDGQTVLTSGARTLATGNSNDGWALDALLVAHSIGATGALEAQGVLEMDGTEPLENTSTFTVDTTQALSITVTVEWSAADADNTITLRELAIWLEDIVTIEPDVQVFISNGTWTMPDGATLVEVICIGGGGGGGGGRRGAASTSRPGGTGGGGGGLSRMTFLAANLDATEAVVVGAAGTGGAAASGDSSNGGTGTAGGLSSFGDVLKANGGTGGTGGTTTSPTASVAGGTGLTSNGGASGEGGTTTNGNAGGVGNWAPSGGGGGYGISNTNNTGFGTGDGTGGGAPTFYAGTLAGGTDPASAGANGGNGNTGDDGWIGSGGAGGGGGGAGAGGNGGTGGSYGGGGGGGAGSLNGNASGAGGNGGPGIVIVITR